MNVDVWYHIRAAKTSGNRHRLAAAIRFGRAQRGTWAEVAQAAGVAPSTARKLAQG